MEVKRKTSTTKPGVYIQFRQREMGKDGRVHVTKSKTITVQDATIAKLEMIVRKAIEGA